LFLRTVFAEKTVSLKSEVPVRFIYADGDKHTFPIEAAGFSRGWGVDPKTNGLAVFLGSGSVQSQDPDSVGLDSLIREALFQIMGIADARKTEVKEGLHRQWYSGNMERIQMLPGDGGTLRSIVPD
jgi:hypothetical protein